ncbi:MAG: hypothetical protein FWF52_05280 [Candidatus Azobacteroides sp.]|nr:hypothetical protein [Candidatus Azobacteroides sp.]
MATTKKVTKISGSENSPQGQKSTFVPTEEAKGRASQLRLFSILLWILAIVAEAGAIYVLIKCQKPIETKSWIWLSALIVVDVILVIIGSQLWKKANRLDPASKKDKVKFFLQNQLGVIIAVIAFLPLVLLIFTNKDLDGKQKGILGAIAVAALVVAGLVSADYNPPSVEQYSEQTSRVEELTGGNTVYWTKSGTRYHLYDDCSHINTNRTEEIFSGTVAQARELKNITELCKTCENRAEKALKEKNLTKGIDSQQPTAIPPKEESGTDEQQ